MLPDLESSNEYDEKSRREVQGNEVDNELHSVEVSISMSPSPDQGSRTPRDEPSSLHSLTKSNLLPDGQLTPVQSTPPKLGKNYTTNEKFSPLFLASPTPESDLEMSVPLPFNGKTDPNASSANMQRFPSTASQPQDPFTQVKRTPYVNGRMQNKSLSVPRTLSSPLKASCSSLINDAINDDTEFVSASVTSGHETSTAGTNGESDSLKTLEDHENGKEAVRLAEGSNSQEVRDSILEEIDESIAKGQQGTKKAEAAKDTIHNPTFLLAGSQSQTTASNQPPVVVEANGKGQTESEQSPPSMDHHTDPIPQLPTSSHAVQTALEIKRKVADASFSSPTGAKRQKRFKVTSGFTFTERSEVPRDPSEKARQYRQDFLASRRSSESSNPAMSPTVSLTASLGTTSEHPRDPSERAWQFRQEFLASRRSSEASTPISSPRLQSAAFTGVIQAKRQDVEVEKESGRVTVQHRSTDSEIERQKMAEVKELSARSLIHEMDSNGTASMKSLGDDAKPGAQNNASFDYGSDSLILVAQKADVESPEAQQSMVIEANSYDSKYEGQRSQSVELDVSFQSSGHNSAENDHANAINETDQIIDRELDLVSESQDELPNTNDDSLPAHTEPDIDHNDLPTQEDAVAEHGSNSPASEIILDRVARPEVAAREPIHQQRSIEEITDIQMPDVTALEPIPQNSLPTVDADTPMLDEIVVECTMQQRLIDVDTNTPMPDVQLDQEIEGPNLNAHASEPTLQYFPAIVVAAELNTESQPHPSRAAAERLANPPSNLGPDSEVNPVEEQHGAAQLPVKNIEQKSPSEPPTIFDKFKETYPSYPGDMKHFTAICRKISQLVKANRMEHQSLWDDFIVRHKIEYPRYLRRCAEEAEDAIAYEDFYQTEIEEPQYQKRVIQPRNLAEALALVANKPSVEQMHTKPVQKTELRVEPMEHKPASDSDLATKRSHYEYASADDGGLLNRMGTKLAFKLATSQEIIREPFESRVFIDTSAKKVRSKTFGDNVPRVESAKEKLILKEASSPGIVQRPSEPITIDLTGHDPPDDPPKGTREREILPRSSVSHLVHSMSVEPPQLQHRWDSSSSKYHMAYTPPTVLGSYAPPPSQLMHSPLPSATASTKRTIKNLRRSLPWEISDHGILQDSSNVAASDPPKRYTSSKLREVRAKESSSGGGAHFQISPMSTPDGPKKSQGLLYTCHRVIQSNWGVKAYEVLEPEYRRGQVLSEAMIELLAEIATKVKIEEARYRIKEVIEARIRDSAPRDNGHPSQDRKILESDLEVVRGVVETSSMSTTSPFSLPHTNAVVKKQSEGTPSEWWDDYNSPFSSFARAYASIRQGKGNSFAKADGAEPGDADKAEATSSGVQLKRIDVMSWKL